MNATRSTNPQPIVPNRASGYEWKTDHFENRPILLPPIAFSAGSLLSTVEDMAKWDAALSSEKLLTKASLDQMWTTTVTNDGANAPFSYGFGWFVDAYHGHRFVQHSGGTPGFSSVIYRFLDEKLTIIILTNHSDMIVDQLAVDLAGICLPALKRSEVNSDPDSKTTAILKDVVSDLLNENINLNPLRRRCASSWERQQARHFGNGLPSTALLVRLFFLIAKIEETVGSYAIEQRWEEIGTGFRPL